MIKLMHLYYSKLFLTWMTVFVLYLTKHAMHLFYRYVDFLDDYIDLSSKIWHQHDKSSKSRQNKEKRNDCSIVVFIFYCTAENVI
jgi:hypothetical protein